MCVKNLLCYTDVEYLRTVLPSNTHPDFFAYLKGLDSSAVSVSAVAEGTVVFARVHAETTPILFNF